MTHGNQLDIYTFLSSLQLIDEQLLKQAYDQAAKTQQNLCEELVKLDVLPAATLGKIMADYYEVPFVELKSHVIQPELLSVLPKRLAEHHRAIIFKQDAHGLHLAMENPSDTNLASFLSKKAGVPVTIYLACNEDIEHALTLYQDSLPESLNKLLASSTTHSDAEDSSTPVIAIVDKLIEKAYISHASDIHIEPAKEIARVRFRIDGIMHEMVTLPKAVYEQVVTRLKVMAQLRTDEQQAAQDGRITAPLENEVIELRISFVPIAEGENIVMRLLTDAQRQFSLQGLGLADKDLKIVTAAYNKPHGMILVTGPTGSGKTTTMYAVLKLLNSPSVNIMTIEDPVEYLVDRVQQIQVNSKVGLTFASGLRSIVRQDPDIILVGEIRDEETASISVNAAMTGHLLLSTLHTNDAATTLPRLADMGIEPYLIASTINVIIAQRLVRKICMACRVSRAATAEEAKHLAPFKSLHSGTATIYSGKGCPVCHQTGYVGRIAIFEVLSMNQEIRDALTSKNDAQTITKLAQANGMSTLFEDGLRKVAQGITTIEEVLRVTKE